MRTARRDGGRLLSERDGRGVLEVVQAPSVALALQRTAGNAAVCRWLAREAKNLAIDNQRVSFGPLREYFRGDTRRREGIDVEIRIGDGIEEAVFKGLRNLALATFKLDAGAKGDPLVDDVHIQDFDLSDFGGSDGRYRFTATATKRGKHGVEGVDVLVERLGAARRSFTPADRLDSKRRNELEKRFSDLGFVRPEPSPLDKEPIGTWTGEQWVKVLQALEYIPESRLKAVPGIAWYRGHGKLGPRGEAGEYRAPVGMPAGGTPERRLTLYDGAFDSEDELIRLVAHELGHALSGQPAERAGGHALARTPEYQAAAKADSPHAITHYGDRDWDEHYAEAFSMFIAEPATMQLLRPKTYEYLAKAR